MINTPAYNSPWGNSNFIVLDLEGTGAQHKEKEGIVEIAAIEIKNKMLTENYYYKLINPQIKIPPMISKIHGLKNKDLEEEVIFDEIKEELLQFINNKILVGHNVNTDYRLLKLKIPDYTPSLILDTKKISQFSFRESRKHNLDKLIERFRIEDLLTDLPIKRGRHSAYFDAYATGIIFLKMLEKKFSGETSLRKIANLFSIKPKGNNNQISLF